MATAHRMSARRAALDTQTQQRRRRADRDKRLEAIAVRILVALNERDAAIAETERRAAEGLREMTDTEGLLLREAVDWVGGQVSLREAVRLRRRLTCLPTTDDAA